MRNVEEKKLIKEEEVSRMQVTAYPSTKRRKSCPQDLAARKLLVILLVSWCCMVEPKAGS